MEDLYSIIESIQAERYHVAAERIERRGWMDREWPGDFAGLIAEDVTALYDKVFGMLTATPADERGALETCERIRVYLHGVELFADVTDEAEPPPG
jgi:hypothetical protein